MNRERKSQRAPFIPGVAVMPEDFGDRLVRLKQATGLTWDGFATAIGVDTRQVLRWRKKGCEPSGGAMLSLVALAEQVPGGMAILMGRDRGQERGAP